MRALTSAACALMVTGCGLLGGQEQPDWSAIRDVANRHRVEVNQVAEQVAENAPLIQAVCALRGDNSTECKALRTLWDIARVSLQAAHAAVDVFDATGVEMIAIDAATDRVAKSAKQLGDAVKRVGEVLHEVVASGDRSGADSGGDPAQSATGQEAPAEGGGSTAGDGRAGSGAKEEVTDVEPAGVPTRPADHEVSARDRSDPGSADAQDRGEASAVDVRAGGAAAQAGEVAP